MTVTADRDLVPGASSDWMRAVAEASAARHVPVDALVAAMDPWRCPPHLLGWLASVFSVDIWVDGWPERKKREVIARSILLHRAKGTLGGIEAHLDLVDCRVVRAITPPAKFYLSSYSRADHKRWLDTLPEIRVYHGTVPVAGGARGALADRPLDLADGTDGFGSPKRYLSSLARVEDEGRAGTFCLARDRAAPTIRNILRAELIEDGTVAELDIESANETGARLGVEAAVERLYFPERRGRGLFLSRLGEPSGGFLDRSCLTGVKRRRYAAHIRRSGQFAADMGSPVVRGREVVDDDPILVPFAEGRRRAPYYLGRPGPIFLSRLSEQRFEYYEAWRLVDPTRPATRGPKVSYLDRDRFGIPPYTAELVVDFTQPAPRKAFYLNRTPLGRGFLHRHGHQALATVCEVARVAKAKRDTVLLDLDYGLPRPLSHVYALDDLTMR